MTMPNSTTPDSTKALDLGGYVVLSLANDPAVLEVMRRAQEALDDTGIQWQPAPTLHVTLAYAPDVSDAMLLDIAGDLHLSWPIGLDFGGVDIFENADSRALHIVVQPNEALAEVQQQVYEAFIRRGIELSPYSVPSRWQPHITLAYLPQGVGLPQIDGSFFFAVANQVVIARGDYEPFATISAPEFKAVKALMDGEEWKLEILAIPFGGPNKGKDAHGQFFDDRTDIHPEQFAAPPLVYYHGRGPDNRPLGSPVYIGRSVSAWEKRLDGWWIVGLLDKAVPEAARVWEAAKRSMAAVSSGSAPHLVRYGRNGHILEWPPIEISVWDRHPNRMPANTYAVAIPAIKALYAQAGLQVSFELGQTTDEHQGGDTGEEQGQPPARGEEATKSNRRGDDMDEQEIKALVAAGVADALKEQEAARKAEEARQAEIKQAAADAVKAARAEWDKETAPSRRLPGGGAPHVSAFADTRRYDHLDSADLAFAVEMMNQAKRKGSSDGPSRAALKALAAKTAEEKSEVAEHGRIALKMIGINPDDALDAVKANELDYTTQSNYGDEFVPSVWSSALWEKIRLDPFVLGRLRQQEFTGPGDTFPIPLEQNDPTFYRLGQATDLNGTTGRPDATIGDSKVGTDKKDMTLGKIGTRVPWSVELDEDSIIPWAAQVRAQTAKAAAEQIEHLLIDGDTATGATTNVNHIGGTPTSTGTKQDLYLTFDGFRKLAIITNSANARSAGGSLLDSDYLQTLQLMGTAGLNALDMMQVIFIQDLNVAWKAAQLLSVKTQDIYSNPTIENGLLKRIWGYPVYNSGFMHFKSTARKANTAGKVDQTTPSNNTTGSILAVRLDQWLVGWKRRMVMKLQDIPDSDSQQLIVTARLGMIYRDTEASAISYNVGV